MWPALSTCRLRRGGPHAARAHIQRTTAHTNIYTLPLDTYGCSNWVTRVDYGGDWYPFSGLLPIRRQRLQHCGLPLLHQHQEPVMCCGMLRGVRPRGTVNAAPFWGCVRSTAGSAQNACAGVLATRGMACRNVMQERHYGLKCRLMETETPSRLARE